MKIICSIMASDYNKPEWGESFEKQTFYRFFENSTYEVVLFDFGKEFKTLGSQAMTSKLINLARQERADVIFVVPFQNEFDLNALSQLSVDDISVIGWGCDDDWRWDDFSHQWASKIPFWVTTYPEVYERVKGTHPSVVLSQWACNPYVFQKKEIPKKYDVSFIGINYGDRKELIEALREAGVKVALFGRGWNESGVDRVSVEQMVDIINKSKINLNFTRSWRKRKRQIKARIFEVVGCGGFLVTEFGEGLDQYLTPGTDLEMFDTKEELVDKVLHYLKNDNEREKIAKSGYDRVRSEHLYTHRFADLFNKVHERRLQSST